MFYELLRQVYIYKLRSLLSRGNQISKQIKLNFVLYVNYKWLTCGLWRWIFVDKSLCGGWGFKDGLVPLNDGRGILDLRGGTGGTGLLVVIVEIFVLVKEFVDVDGTIDLFIKRAWDIDVESLREGATSPLLTGIGGCGRPLVRNVAVGFFNGVEFVEDGNFERFIFIFVITVGLDLTEIDEDLFVLFDVSERFSRNIGDERGKSVSSKLSESDFDATDNELALLWSI